MVDSLERLKNLSENPHFNSSNSGSPLVSDLTFQTVTQFYPDKLSLELRSILDVVSEDMEIKTMVIEQMGWLAWLIVGAIAGWLASKVMRSSQGLLTDILVGIVGGFIGGFLFNQFGTAGVTGFNVWSVFVAFTGAVLLLALVRLFSGRRVLSR